MTIDGRRNDLNETDLKIAIALGCGATRERAAELAGVSVSTVYNHHEQPITKTWAAYTRLCAESVIARQVEVNSASIRAEWEKRRAKALEVHDEVMKQVEGAPGLALRAAENVFDRADGKPTQTLKTSSTTDVKVTYSLPVDLLTHWQAEARALVAPAKQLTAAPALPILDADPIES